MSYQALYRVFRPQFFHDVIGQGHVTKTLQNALLQQKISHAYLFSGPRGTGKTSAAKILAKAVNCEKGPTAEPCNECDSCKGITDGSISDVIEIDAASNNGVEEIRDIRDKVKFAPSSVPYKVYIIDEVHMLSIGAFNALLKTLEEPPKHVIFILATTEPHKIPLTIISRCQRFDFKRITIQDIVGWMKHIADEASVEADEKALHIIARAAEGGMRDALSLFDQTISFSQGSVTLDDALTVTGSVAQSHLNKLAKAVHEKDTATAIMSLEELIYHGKDPSRFTEDFILYFRDMLLYKTAPNLEESLQRVLLDDEFKSLAEEIPAHQIYEYIDTLNKTQQEMKFTNNARIYLEVSLVKLCQTSAPAASASSDSGDYQALVGKITELENELRQLKAQGPVHTQPDAGSVPAKKQARSTKGFRVQAGKIQKVLKEATREDLSSIKSRWGDMLDMLNQRQMRSQAALLNDAEPAAASSDAFVLKFKYEIHCQMAMDNHIFLQTITAILQEFTGNTYQPIGVPEEQWMKIREDFIQNGQGEEGSEDGAAPEEDPFIAEARKLVGADLLEVKD